MLEIFSLKSPHLKVAHLLWKEHLKAGDTVLDATFGNGHDTAFVAPLVLPGGRVIALDLQKEAIEKGKKESLEGVECILESHATYPNKLNDASLDLAIYNLGYLPGGDKNFITEKETTLESLYLVLKKLKLGGVLTVTTYSGHAGGDVEETAVETFLTRLERKQFGLVSFSWPNRPKSPKLFVVKRLELQLEPLEKGHCSKE